MSDYVLGDMLGQGGMGAVYRAVQRPLGRNVAIKFLPAELLEDPEAVKRFGREVEACAKLSHPNVIKILDHGRLEGKLFYAMELIEGAGTIVELIRRRGPLDRDLAGRLMDQLLDALEFCHAHGFIHRDIKPGNVMVRDDGHLVLMDFGLVKPTDHTVITREGQRIGTPRYTAPEVLMGRPAGPASDLFSAGEVFYEMLAGVPAFEADSMRELLTAILQRDPPMISRRRPDLPVMTNEILSFFLAKDPAHRFASAAAAREAVRSWREAVAGGPRVMVRRPVVVSAALHPPEGGRGHRWMALAAAVAIAGGLAAWALAPKPALPPSTASPPPTAATPLEAVAPALDWSTASVTVRWSSTQVYSATVRVVPEGRGGRGLEARQTGPSREHVLTVKGLEPGAPHHIEGLMGDRTLFSRLGRTTTVARSAARLFKAMEGYEPGKLFEDRRHRVVERTATTTRPGAVSEAWARWRDEVWRRYRHVRMAGAVEDFEPVRDAYFTSVEANPFDKAWIAEKARRQRALEDLARARGLEIPVFSDRLVSRAMGPLPRSRLVRPSAMVVEYAPGSFAASGLEVAAASVRRSTDGDQVAAWGVLGGDGISLQQTWLSGVDELRSDTEFDLPLPDAGRIGAAEAHAVVERLNPMTPLLLRLKGRRHGWLTVAALRPAGSGREALWHSLDARLLLPGLRLRVEVRRIPEAPLPAPGPRVAYVAFLWEEPRPARR